MQSPLQFYTENKEKLLVKHQELKRKLTNNSFLRLAVFLGTVLGVYFTFQTSIIAIIIALVGIVIFVFFVVKHTSLQRKKAVLEAKIDINTTEIDVLHRKFTDLDTGKEFINPQHFYSNDIDLFGVGSFFQYINRTTTKDGKKLLADTLTGNDFLQIEEKQKALKELAEKIEWQQHFSAIASLVTEKKNAKTISDWIVKYQSKLPNFLNNLPIIFSAISLILIGLLTFKLIPFSIIVLWFFIGLGITGKYFKPTQELYNKAGKAKETFKQYYLLLSEIENEDFKSAILKEKQNEIIAKNKKASEIFKSFSKILDAFDQRNNIIIAVFGNGLFLWDIQNATKTEKWIANYKNTVEKWFNVVSFFDAQNSLANFVYNHPAYIFPSIQKDRNIISSENLGHPLLDPTKRIDNHFTIDNKQFFIITGANMAGKSTFLRTVSLSIVMANCGLPVCAKSFNYQPIKLITSMRTSDSLTDDASYFYSELKRLKFIVDEIKTDNYFIILDEILKGTNSKDKAIGSKKFVEKLNNSKSTGIIATHDISLCELADEYPQIENYFFDAEIINDELFFDYKMKNGVCKNMNASFLLKKMEIV